MRACDSLYGPKIPLHVPLVLEMRQFVSSSESELFASIFVDERFHRPYIGRTGYFAMFTAAGGDRDRLSYFYTSIWLYQAEIMICEIYGYLHLCSAGGLSTIFVIVVESFRDLDVALVESFVIGMAFPAPVRGFVMTHDEERRRLVTLIDERYRFVRDDVGSIALRDLDA